MNFFKNKQSKDTASEPPELPPRSQSVNSIDAPPENTPETAVNNASPKQLYTLIEALEVVRAQGPSAFDLKEDASKLELWEAVATFQSMQQVHSHPIDYSGESIDRAQVEQELNSGRVVQLDLKLAYDETNDSKDKFEMKIPREFIVTLVPNLQKLSHVLVIAAEKLLFKPSDYQAIINQKYLEINQVLELLNCALHGDMEAAQKILGDVLQTYKDFKESGDITQDLKSRMFKSVPKRLLLAALTSGKPKGPLAGYMRPSASTGEINVGNGKKLSEAFLGGFKPRNDQFIASVKAGTASAAVALVFALASELRNARSQDSDRTNTERAENIAVQTAIGGAGGAAAAQALSSSMASLGGVGIAGQVARAGIGGGAAALVTSSLAMVYDMALLARGKITVVQLRKRAATGLGGMAGGLGASLGVVAATAALIATPPGWFVLTAGLAGSVFGWVVGAKAAEKLDSKLWNALEDQRDHAHGYFELAYKRGQPSDITAKQLMERYEVKYAEKPTSPTHQSECRAQALVIVYCLYAAEFEQLLSAAETLADKSQLSTETLDAAAIAQYAETSDKIRSCADKEIF